MPVPANAKYPVPESAAEFEKLATDVAGRYFGCQFQRNGRTGQVQDGVDAYAQLDGQSVIGLQHKNAKVTKAVLKRAVIEAEALRPPLTHFVLMTSAPRDSKMQQAVREVTAERLQQKRFRVSALFWEDICEVLGGQKDLVEKYYPVHFRAGAPRVRAWVHQVLNPLIDALDEHACWLKHRNLRWRFYNRGTEFVHTTACCVAAQPTLEDFERANPAIRLLSSQHDEHLERATKAASAAFDELAASPVFRSAVFERIDAYRRERGANEKPGGAFTVEQLPGLVAQHVVNGVKQISVGHSDRDFWMLFGAEFRSLASGRTWDELDQATSGLAKHVLLLRHVLADQRFGFCETYGIAVSP